MIIPYVYLLDYGRISNRCLTALIRGRSLLQGDFYIDLNVNGAAFII